MQDWSGAQPDRELQAAHHLNENKQEFMLTDVSLLLVAILSSRF